MTGSRDRRSIRCLECDAVIPRPDPVVGWWLCDDCELAFDGDGRRITGGRRH
ncbi:hypothetical protein [Natrinema salaciae]|uniref:Uncharacterized protein n=1 Tax=Natrinema salaciae TaxID=1186196 RepID=A0A1H9S5Y4_9EURY|nr:hypothetical protein [Natrinema salaciae]SER80348.1 hypothetical protein SAMN04489841_4593 [Natrinema salaciae]